MRASPGTARISPPTRGAAAGRPRAAAAAAAGAGATVDKVVHLIRHGETEMNVALGLLPRGARYGEPNFKDPWFPDTQLTDRGRRQAAVAREEAAELAPPPEVVVVSPLTRALQTADIVFQGNSAPRVAHHWATERLYLSSDVGQVREVLEGRWENYCFQALPRSTSSTSSSSTDVSSSINGSSSDGGGSDGASDGSEGSGGKWWHVESSEEGQGGGAEEEGGWWAGAASYLQKRSQATALQAEELDLVQGREPPEVFLQRVERLRQWLASRPESSLAVVTHWGVLHALTGTEFHNCEVRSLRLSQLRARPHLLTPSLQTAAGRVA